MPCLNAAAPSIFSPPHLTGSPPAGARFRSDMQKLQSELWDEDMSLDVDSLQQHHDQHLKVGFFVWCPSAVCLT